ncbi:Repetin [Streptomyces sp. NPDC051561]|uniref:Repetin n=1 Tax=Streptomyces sp. NPDC051561 TaxID=3365658 RepID=UPI0037BDF541
MTRKTRHIATSRRTRLVALSVALLVTAGVAGTAAASAVETGTGSTVSTERPTTATTRQDPPREAAALTGKARLDRPEHVITFAFDAHLPAGAFPDKATGKVGVRHQWPDGTVQWADVKVDCLVTGGKVAVVTGTVAKSNIAGQHGKRVGITVDDRPKGDRLGYSWLLNGHLANQPRGLGKCLGSAPIEKVDAKTGDFKVLPLELG